MNPVTVCGYIDYFRQLAVRHKEIQHQPTSENGDASPGTQKFCRWNVEEAVSGLRSKMGWPGLLLEMYEIVTRSPSPYDVKGVYSGAFTVLDKTTSDNTQSEVDAFSKTETIYQDMLKQIWQDHYGTGKDRCSTPFAEFYFDNLNIVPVGPILDRQCGWRVEFQFKPRTLVKITEAPTDAFFEQ
jgi:hypothetical protein